MLDKVVVGVTYRNKKNKQFYLVKNIVKHSETLENMVLYVALYKSDNLYWVRPYDLFLEKFEEIS